MSVAKITYPGDFFCIPRKSKHLNTYNAYGCSLVELCCVFNVHIMDGRCSSDIEGDFTCNANNGTSVVDYTITSSNIFDKTDQFYVTNFDASIHLPVCCSLEFTKKHPAIEYSTDIQGLHEWTKYTWKSELKETFLNKFKGLFKSFQSYFRTANLSSLDLLPEFIKLYQSGALSMKRKINKSTQNKKQPHWWDNYRITAKLDKLSPLRHFRQTNTSEALTSYINKRKHFKLVCKLKKKSKF